MLELIEDVSHAIQLNAASLFIGAGISIPSGAPSWLDLIGAECRRIGLTAEAFDDLPALAQYVVNEHVGNRGPIVNHIRSQLSKILEPNHYHRSILPSAFRTIWTTNFDCLLETMYSGHRVVVRKNDSDMSRPADDADVEIIKLHGCVTGSSKDLVFTKEDYEDYFFSRPATAERLRADLLRKTFLFIGYNFGDPNIDNIVTQARRQADQATRRHYMIQRRVTDNEKLKLRQGFWVKDLKRIGIHCHLISEYTELTNILEKIALCSRGPTVYVTGSHKLSNTMAQELGVALAKIKNPSIVAIDGQSEGIGRSFITAFGNECIQQQVDLRERIRLFINPYAVNRDFASDVGLQEVLKAIRRPMILSAQVVVVFDGAMGTQLEIDLAISLGCTVIPVSITSDDYPAKLLEKPAVISKLKHLAPQYLEACRLRLPTVEDVTECVNQVIIAK